MARLEARVAALEEVACDLRSLSDAELEHRLGCLVAAAIGRTPTDDELPALLATLKEKPHGA